MVPTKNVSQEAPHISVISRSFFVIFLPIQTSLSAIKFDHRDGSLIDFVNLPSFPIVQLSHPAQYHLTDISRNYA